MGQPRLLPSKQSAGRSVRAAGGSFARTVRRGGDQPREARGSEVSEGYRAIPFKMDATSAHKTTPIAPNSSSCSRSQPMAVPRKHGCPTPQRLATVCSSAFTTRTRRTKLRLRRHRIPALLKIKLDPATSVAAKESSPLAPCVEPSGKLTPPASTETAVSAGAALKQQRWHSPPQVRSAEAPVHPSRRDLPCWAPSAPRWAEPR